MEPAMIIDEEAVAVSQRRAALVVEVAELAAHLHAADARLVELIAEADEIGAWDGWKSLPQWLSASGGFTLGEAQKRCRLRALPTESPEVFERLQRGRFSVGVAGMVADVVDDSCMEHVLDVIDRLAPTQMSTALGKFRKLRPPAPSPPAPPATSSHHSWSIGENGRRIEITLEGIRGALYGRALDAAREHLTRNPDQPPADGGEDAPRRLVSDLEAFEHMLGMTVSNASRDDLAEWAGDDLRLQVDVDLDDMVERNRIGRFLNGTTISGVDFDELACDCTLQMYFHRSGIPLNYGREHRLANRMQRRALLQRDGGCVYPGCHARKHLIAHHIVHWADGGLTDLANLVLLCTYHHRLVHRFHVSIEAGPGATWWFWNRDGTPIGDPSRKSRPVEPLEAHHARHRRRPIDPCGARARHLGEPLTPYALDVLLQHLLDPV